MSFWVWFPLAFVGWLIASVAIGWVVGRVLWLNTEDPPPHAGDLLDLEDITWDFPRKDIA